MKTYKITISRKEIEVTQNEDGSFNKPDIVKELEPIGTALKPAFEPICMAMKPLSEKNYVANVLKWGTGGINIDESRVETSDNLNGGAYSGGERSNGDWKDNSGFKNNKLESFEQPLGRFPANLLHDNSEEVRECFPDTKASKKRIVKDDEKLNKKNTVFETSGYKERFGGGINDNGGNASRFFKSIIYQAKASKSERNKGMDDIEAKEWKQENSPNPNREERPFLPVKNNHPTVKPIALCEYLIKMVTPKFVFVCERCYNGKYEKQKTNSETSPMQKLRGGIQAEGQLSQRGILHEEMCISGCEDKQGEELPILQKDIHDKKDGQESTEILQSVLCSTGYGNEKEGENSKNTERLFGDIQAREQNGEQTRNGNATQSCNGGENRKGLTINRGGASYKSQKRRQQGRELNGNDTTGTQQNTEVKKESSVSSLSENRRCPNCGESMVKRAGVVLDPFAGSGSTLVAAKQNGFNYIGIEMTEEYIPIIKARLLGVENDLFKDIL